MDHGHFPGFKPSGELYDIRKMLMFQEARGNSVDSTSYVRFL
jgi:hypothetical protein